MYIVQSWVSTLWHCKFPPCDIVLKDRKIYPSSLNLEFIVNVILRPCILLPWAILSRKLIIVSTCQFHCNWDHLIFTFSRNRFITVMILTPKNELYVALALIYKRAAENCQITAFSLCVFGHPSDKPLVYISNVLGTLFYSLPYIKYKKIKIKQVQQKHNKIMTYATICLLTYHRNAPVSRKTLTTRYFQCLHQET